MNITAIHRQIARDGQYVPKHERADGPQPKGGINREQRRARLRSLSKGKDFTRSKGHKR